MSDFAVTRSAIVHAPRERVHALIEHLHAWERWSPWQQADPAMTQTCCGADCGVGARMAWSGDKAAGQGGMEVLRSEIVETGEGTEVTWAMSGAQNLLMKVMFRVLKMERGIGDDFERRLARPKVQAEPA